MVVFQFANDIRAGKKVCYTLSRCPHRLAAKDATLSRWISRVRIPLGAPQHLSRSRRVFRLGLFSFPHMCAKPVRQMCAKSAENRPEIHREGNGEDPRPHGEQPRRGPFNCPARPLGYRFACPFAWPFARPSATRFAWSLARPPARVRSPLGYPWQPLGRAPLGYPLATLAVRLCPSARLPHRRGPPRTRADHPAQAKGGPLPHETARPSALDIPLCARPRHRRISRAPAPRRRHR